MNLFNVLKTRCRMNCGSALSCFHSAVMIWSAAFLFIRAFRFIMALLKFNEWLIVLVSKDKSFRIALTERFWMVKRQFSALQASFYILPVFLAWSGLLRSSSSCLMLCCWWLLCSWLAVRSLLLNLPFYFSCGLDLMLIYRQFAIVASLLLTWWILAFTKRF